MFKLRCLLTVFLVLAVTQAASAWWWKRKDCPQQPHCPITCASGFVSQTDYKGCTTQLCKCKNVCEHFNCPPATRCQKKFHCKRWGGCSVYPTCVVVLNVNPTKGLNADPTELPTTKSAKTTPTTTTPTPTRKPTTEATTVKVVQTEATVQVQTEAPVQVQTEAKVQVITQRTAAPNVCQNGEQHLAVWRCGPQDLGSRPCPGSYQCELVFGGRYVCCPITETTSTTTTTPVPTTAPPVTVELRSGTRKSLISTSLCRDGKPQLAGWYCGRGGEPCPSTHKCLIDPTDRYAVCCPIPVPDDEPSQIPVSQKKLPMCEQPKKAGFCKSSLPRWYFNAKSGQCEFFRYGGCEGNANNFNSKESCERACGKPGVSYCSLPSEVGRCRAAFHRFYYEPASGTCKEFTFGGCEGNGNNFVSVAQCEQYCS